MGLLDGMLGNLIGGEFGGVVNTLLNSQGGLPGLVSSLERGGLAEAVQSWVGTGTNLPVSADQLHQALGPEMVQQLAQQAGMNPQDIVQQLAKVLPGFVDRMTPGGFLPK